MIENTKAVPGEDHLRTFRTVAKETIDLATWGELKQDHEQVTINMQIAPRTNIPDPEPDCLTPWSWPMIQVWLKNHPDFSLGCEYITGQFQGWKCQGKFWHTTASTAAEAVQMAARVQRSPDKQDK